MMPRLLRLARKELYIGVDDIGSVMVAWDNGSSLSALLGIDEVEIVEGGRDDGKGFAETDE